MDNNENLFNNFIVKSLVIFIIMTLILIVAVNSHINIFITNEIWIQSGNINPHIKQITVEITIIVILGLILLYVSLMRIVYSSSKTLSFQNKELIKKRNEIESAYAKLNNSYKNTIIALSNSIDAKDTYTAGHSSRVANISLKIGKQLELNEEELNTLYTAALLHDIGKIGIPDEILKKKDKLNDYEYTKIKEHSAIGADMLKDVTPLHNIVPIILYHHERVDGTGYPFGLNRNNIPLEALIIAVADSYDAMTSNRPYREALSRDTAINQIIKFKGTQYDCVVVDAFIKCITENDYKMISYG
ncbi:HD-GYP domain-containing protein [Sedimentibacter sp.]|uniref:HD-GYP domain-containing protein n=1 Tax=Sedimentibacter sp. TaxID=1960295 RepID=UPI0028AD046A|nr:HD-GYP domain-containing protein [Sedimentibacter sp.]